MDYSGLAYRHRHLYVCWKAMIYRCDNPSHPAYKHYGGRGIKVCPEWKDNFLIFLDWAVKNGYRRGLTLDRTDNSQGYSPANCKWVDWKSQARNRRKLRTVEYRGRTICIGELSELCGIPLTTLRQRIIAYGWSIERATTERVRRIS